MCLYCELIINKFRSHVKNENNIAWFQTCVTSKSRFQLPFREGKTLKLTRKHNIFVELLVVHFNRLNIFPNLTFMFIDSFCKNEDEQVFFRPWRKFVFSNQDIGVYLSIDMYYFFLFSSIFNSPSWREDQFPRVTCLQGITTRTLLFLCPLDSELTANYSVPFAFFNPAISSPKRSTQSVNFVKYLFKWSKQ